MQAPHVEGREFESRSNQVNDLDSFYLSLLGVALGNNRVGQGLVGSVSDILTEYDIGS